MKKYKCKDCQGETDILSLGDMYQGCATCGGHTGFQKNVDGKWIDHNGKNEDTDKLHKFISGF
jgi:hypothetical protein